MTSLRARLEQLESSLSELEGSPAAGGETTNSAPVGRGEKLG
jgi:hypothetical protein